jgi:hypothetical protein
MAAWGVSAGYVPRMRYHVRFVADDHLEPHYFSHLHADDNHQAQRLLAEK